MSDPGTTYRTREEVQRMRSTQDPIRGLQRYIEEWGIATEQELKVTFTSTFFYDETDSTLIGP
jgi:pyruvate dehydrogenase E1 component alpha subunit